MTTDAKQIEPALSADQWVIAKRMPRDNASHMPRVMALANYDMSDDSPHKITQTDLEAILTGVGCIEDAGSEYDHSPEDRAETLRHVDALQAVHDKLAALLPPE